MKLFTIGFTKTTAEHFFQRLKDAGVKTLIDTRLNRDGQLAGFAKASDLAYFLDRLASINYRPEPSLAPTADALRDYREKRISWSRYAELYSELLAQRMVEQLMRPEELDRSCLLCSEDKPTHCHRSLAAEYLKRYEFSDQLEIVHL